MGRRHLLVHANWDHEPFIESALTPSPSPVGRERVAPLGRGGADSATRIDEHKSALRTPHSALGWFMGRAAGAVGHQFILSLQPTYGKIPAFLQSLAVRFSPFDCGC